MKKIAPIITLLSLAISLALPALPVHAASLTNGRIAYLSQPDSESNAGGRLVVRNQDGSTRYLTDGTQSQTALFESWSPDGKYIAYNVVNISPALTFTIYVINTEGTPKPLALTTMGGEIAPVWSPDGMYIYYTGVNQALGVAGIYRIKADGSVPAEAVAVDPGVNQEFLGLSRDGKTVSFTKMPLINDGDQPIDLYVKSSDGSGVARQLTAMQANQTAELPTWSPDNTKIAYLMYDNNLNVYSLHVINSDGSGDTQVTLQSEKLKFGYLFGVTNVWSPDSKHILYTDYDSMNQYQSIFIAQADGSPPTQLTSDIDQASYPTWSPDGTKILFSGLSAGPSTTDIYTVNTDGTDETDITNTPNDNEALAVWEAVPSSPPSQVENGVTVTTIAPGENYASSNIVVHNNNVLENNGSVGNVIVESGGVAKGRGIYGTISVQSGGILAPGNSPGCIASSDLTLNGTYQVDVGGITACSGYDQTNVTGTVNITGANLEINAYAGFVPAKGNAFSIITNDGSDAVQGTFKYAGQNLGEGSTFTAGRVTYHISYKGGDGNDVVLTVDNVAPIPGTPNTGFTAIGAHPIVLLGLTTSLSAGLFTMAIVQRRYIRV